MWLVDTSVWIDHFRKEKSGLTDLLLEGSVLMHPHVRGELACGNLKNRSDILFGLEQLCFADVATDSEAWSLLENRHLWGRGLGWVDIHLLASALITHCKLWTLDRKLAQAALELGLD